VQWYLDIAEAAAETKNVCRKKVQGGARGPVIQSPV
jgi:hypothetical protein